MGLVVMGGLLRAEEVISSPPVSKLELLTSTDGFSDTILSKMDEELVSRQSRVGHMYIIPNNGQISQKWTFWSASRDTNVSMSCSYEFVARFLWIQRCCFFKDHPPKGPKKKT